MNKMVQCTLRRVVHNVARCKVFLKGEVGEGVDVAGTLDEHAVLCLNGLQHGEAICLFISVDFSKIAAMMTERNQSPAKES